VGGADDAGDGWGGGFGVGLGGAVEGALVDGGDFEGVEEQAGALEVDLSGGDGLEEHGGDELDRLGVFQRRELDLVLMRVGAGDDELVVVAAGLGPDAGFLPGGVERLDPLGAAVGEMELVVEEAEGASAQGGRLAAAAIGFDVAAEDEIGVGGVHSGAFRS
jgi:hypothetical protein